MVTVLRVDRWRRVTVKSLLSKRDCESRRRNAATAEQTAARRSTERSSRSQRRRQAQKSANDFEAALIDIDNACIVYSKSFT